MYEVNLEQIMKTKIVIHIGLHKTGTTFLQQEIFSKIPNINYQNTVNLTTKVVPNVINVFSDENLDGGSYRLFNIAGQRYTILKNLHALFPDAYIILCLRDKDAWLQSAYKQYAMAYFGYTFLEYFRKFDKRVLDFDVYVKYLQSLFGVDNVLVTSYENLKNEPEEFVDRICSFIGVDAPTFENQIVYPSLTDRQIALIVIFDAIFRSKTLHLLLALAIRLVRNDPMMQRWKAKKV